MNYTRIEWNDPELINYFDEQKHYAYRTEDNKYIICPVVRQKTYKTRPPKTVKMFVIKRCSDKRRLYAVYDNGMKFERKFDTVKDAKRTVERMEDILYDRYDFY